MASAAMHAQGAAAMDTSVGQGAAASSSFSSSASMRSETRYDKKTATKLGEGTYGVVYKARDTHRGCDVALKKVRMDAWNEGVPTTALREIAVLKEIRHRNIVALQDVFVTQNNHLYLVFELLDRDLKQCMDTVKDVKDGRDVVPRSIPGPSGLHLPTVGLHPKVVKWYTYQMLAGVRACHESRIVHRDIKPQNILLNASGDLKIADFGLARTYAIPLRPYTHEVVTLWYRAPEILLGEHTYSPAVDIWSVGCIMLEMAAGRPLFEGDSEIDQIHRIFRVLGHPTEDAWHGVTGLPDYSDKMPNFRKLPVHVWARALDDQGRDLLCRMLEYDPTRRVSAADALKHEYFADIQGIEAEARRLVGDKAALDRAEAARDTAARERREAHKAAVLAAQQAQSQAQAQQMAFQHQQMQGQGFGYGPVGALQPGVGQGQFLGGAPMQGFGGGFVHG